MKADITISKVYWNKGLSNFFFRNQALKTLEDLVSRATSGQQEAIKHLDNVTSDMDIDEVEECFYEMSLPQLANEFDIELDEDESEEDE